MIWIAKYLAIGSLLVGIWMGTEGLVLDDMNETTFYLNIIFWPFILIVIVTAFIFDFILTILVGKKDK